MAKIPKNRSDKEMLAGYEEEATLADRFLKAEAAAKKAAAETRKDAEKEVPAELLRAGFTPALTDALGKALMELKFELAGAGVTKYTFKIRREGEGILLMPKY